MSDDEIAPIRCNCQTINLDGDIEWMDNDEALVVMKRLQKWAAIQSSDERLKRIIASAIESERGDR